MSLAEIAAVSIACFLALVELTAYLMDAAGFGISPTVILLISILVTALVTRTIVERSSSNERGTTVDRSSNDALWLLVVVSVFGLVLRFAWPSLLPPGKGPDLTHHLLLIDYIERNWHLVHDLRLESAMGEMAHYTPGSHLLAVLFGAWTGTDGLRAVYPLMAACAAMTVGFVFLITTRTADRRAPLYGAPLALISVALVLFTRAYFVDAFAHDSYVAQVISALFAVALWWATIVWDEHPAPANAAVMALLAVGTFLAWPVWIGPPLLAFYLAVLFRREIPFGARARDVAIVTVPLLIVAAIHAIGQLGWALIVRTSGAVLQPSLQTAPLAALGIVGAVLCIRDRRTRVSELFVLAILLQAVTLYVMAKSIGSQTPYMAFKMGYLALYPLAALGGLSVQRFKGSKVQGFKGSKVQGFKGSKVQGFKGSIEWIAAIALLVVAIRPLIAAPKPTPVVSLDFYKAGQWTRANVGQACVDYLVEDPYTAYWLHLAVLGNPRATSRTAEVDEHNLRHELAKWIPVEGHPYAIADLTLLPDEIRARVELVKQFGRAGIIHRPGRTCELLNP